VCVILDVSFVCSFHHSMSQTLHRQQRFTPCRKLSTSQTLPPAAAVQSVPCVEDEWQTEMSAIGAFDDCATFTYEAGGGLYKLKSVETHSLKPPGFIQPLEPISRKTGFKPLLSNGSTCTATARTRTAWASCRRRSRASATATRAPSGRTTVGMYKLNPVDK
jgi:hypothetical protein